MAYNVLMPQLGLTMEEGAVARWNKQEGDTVQSGEVLLEITTDKLSSEVVSEHDGILLKIVAQEGEDVPVRGTLCIIGQPGEATGSAAPAWAAAPAEAPKASAENVPAPPASLAGARIRISPLARKTAEKLGVNYETIRGCGTGGRITQKDVLLASAEKKDLPSAPEPLVPTGHTKPLVPEKPPAAPCCCGLMEGDAFTKLTGMRKVVAQRMLQSHTEIPPVTQNTKADVTELMKFRKLLAETAGKKYSVNDLILKAAAKALRAHPEILVSYCDGQIIRRAHVNLGMAVALDTGLIVPVIRDADRMGLDALSLAAKDLALRAKENKLSPEEYKGSTFSVSNLGMFGIETFTPIINQPDAAILGVCAVTDELVMDDAGAIAKRQVMRLSLTYDHRLIDGAVAAKFVMALRDLLQAPMNIVL